MDTWWLRTDVAIIRHTSSTAGSSYSGESSSDGYSTSHDNTESFIPSSNAPTIVDKRTRRMIEWVTEILLSQLKVVVASRSAPAISGGSKKAFASAEMSAELMIGGNMPMAELKNNLSFSESTIPDVKGIVLDAQVVEQTRNFVEIIASMYKAHPCKSRRQPFFCRKV